MVKMYYYGCVNRPGHFMFSPALEPWLYKCDCPWRAFEAEKLAPHAEGCRKTGICRCAGTEQGVAVIHHKDGWTALSFWDRSVDFRAGSSSTFFAQGDYDFAEMCAFAASQFPTIWKRFSFQVKEWDGVTL